MALTRLSIQAKLDREGRQRVRRSSSVPAGERDAKALFTYQGGRERGGLRSKISPSWREGDCPRVPAPGRSKAGRLSGSSSHCHEQGLRGPTLQAKTLDWTRSSWFWTRQTRREWITISALPQASTPDSNHSTRAPTAAIPSPFAPPNPRAETSASLSPAPDSSARSPLSRPAFPPLSSSVHGAVEPKAQCVAARRFGVGKKRGRAGGDETIRRGGDGGVAGSNAKGIPRAVNPRLASDAGEVEVERRRPRSAGARVPSFCPRTITSPPSPPNDPLAFTHNRLLQIPASPFSCFPTRLVPLRRSSTRNRRAPVVCVAILTTRAYLVVHGPGLDPETCSLKTYFTNTSRIRPGGSLHPLHLIPFLRCLASPGDPQQRLRSRISPHSLQLRFFTVLHNVLAALGLLARHVLRSVEPSSGESTVRSGRACGSRRGGEAVWVP